MAVGTQFLNDDQVSGPSGILNEFSSCCRNARMISLGNTPSPSRLSRILTKASIGDRRQSAQSKEPTMIDACGEGCLRIDVCVKRSHSTLELLVATACLELF